MRSGFLAPRTHAVAMLQRADALRVLPCAVQFQTAGRKLAPEPAIRGSRPAAGSYQLLVGMREL